MRGVPASGAGDTLPAIGAIGASLTTRPLLEGAPPRVYGGDRGRPVTGPPCAAAAAT